MYKVIRCGTNYDLVIVVTPENAGPETPGVKCYRYASWHIGNHKPNVFNEITVRDAEMYFSGHADGLGYGKLSQEIFSSLEEAASFISKEKRNLLDKLLA